MRSFTIVSISLVAFLLLASPGFTQGIQGNLRQSQEKSVARQEPEPEEEASSIVEALKSGDGVFSSIDSFIGYVKSWWPGANDLMDSDLCDLTDIDPECYVRTYAGLVGATWDTQEFDEAKADSIMAFTTIPTGTTAGISRLMCKHAYSVLPLTSFEGVISTRDEIEAFLLEVKTAAALGCDGDQSSGSRRLQELHPEEEVVEEEDDEDGEPSRRLQELHPEEEVVEEEDDEDGEPSRRLQELHPEEEVVEEEDDEDGEPSRRLDEIYPLMRNGGILENLSGLLGPLSPSNAVPYLDLVQFFPMLLKRPRSSEQCQLDGIEPSCYVSIFAREIGKTWVPMTPFSSEDAIAAFTGASLGASPLVADILCGYAADILPVVAVKGFVTTFDDVESFLTDVHATALQECAVQ